MGTPWRLLLLGLTLLVVGCGQHPCDVAPVDTPLTLEQWKALPPQTKYEIATLERLKQGNPKLQDQREWDKFTRNVLLPSKKKELPNGRPKS
jgi:hypothetical protein